ncbi:MAG: helix-turn-helix transcriptional regulator [Sciscionella sp.]|nr:helix-turn-helix transcriptional regulator [Sciscionella sp.]
MSSQESSAPLKVIAAALRKERTAAGVSLTELAKRAGIAKSTLSQLESGGGNPSVETLWALAVALNVPFSRLVDPPKSTVRILRAGEGPAVHSEQTNFVGTLLSSCPPNARRDVYLIRIEPGAPRIAEPHIAGTVEHVVVAAGSIRTGPADEPIELATGDYAAFPGDVPHIYQARAKKTWVTLVMEHV